MSFLIPLLILAGVALYLMTPQERMRLLRAALATVGHGLHIMTQGSPESERLHEILRARTRWPLVTGAIVVVNVVVFGYMVLEPGAVSDPDTLIRWGANYGPRTTNSEWWRMVAALFVHSGLLHLLATMAGLVPLGLVLERLVGSVTFATVYLATGILAGFMSLSESALAVGVGASGAIFGLYGLMLASLIWGIAGRAAIPVPLATIKAVGMPAAVFFLYNLVSSDLSTAGELMGIASGFIGGLVLARGIAERKPPVRRIAAAAAATFVMSIASAVPLRGTADVRPALERVVSVEERTAAAYDAKVVQFRKGWISAETLAASIDRTILPELQAAHARVKALKGVPREHRPLVAAAEEYFRLREEAWRRRAEGLINASMRTLQEADRTERASLDAFRRIKQTG